jgi:hypothetical protein
MQRAIYHQATWVQRQSRVLPGHATGLVEQASNDDLIPDEPSMLKLVLSVLANVIGGTLLLSGMFVMPHIIARIFA